jgi:mitochondrial cardiolipin hydrolase
MSNPKLIDQIRQEIIHSISDNHLIKSEKKTLKHLLIELAADKNIADVLRSEIFDLAAEHLNAENSHDILRWVEDLNKLILFTQSKESLDESVYFSPGEECLSAILHQIKSASKIIQICLFTISDNRISEELLSKHSSGVHVKIITDNDKVNDKGSDIDQLSRAGIPIKVDVSSNHMHHKFALFDKKTLLTGSYNWTRSAERYNHENIIISDSPKMMKEFEREYVKLWNQLVFYV